MERGRERFPHRSGLGYRLAAEGHGRGLVTCFRGIWRWHRAIMERASSETRLETSEISILAGNSWRDPRPVRARIPVTGGGPGRMAILAAIHAQPFKIVRALIRAAPGWPSRFILTGQDNPGGAQIFPTEGSTTASLDPLAVAGIQTICLPSKTLAGSAISANAVLTWAVLPYLEGENGRRMRE